MSLSPRTSLRLLGILPLVFFLAQGVHYWPRNELGDLLWMCNVGNLLLAMGLLLERALVIRLAAIWTIPGLFVWFVYVVLPWSPFLSSTLAHVGGLIVAMIALSRVRMDRSAWRWAFGWYLMVEREPRACGAARMGARVRIVLAILARVDVGDGDCIVVMWIASVEHLAR